MLYVSPAPVLGASRSCPCSLGACRLAMSGMYSFATSFFHLMESVSVGIPSTCWTAGSKPDLQRAPVDLDDGVVTVRPADVRPQRLPEAVREEAPRRASSA